MVRDKCSLIETQYNMPMYEILKELAARGHNKASAARHLGYERAYFTGTLCKRIDPEKTIDWGDQGAAARAAQRRRWDNQPLCSTPINDILEMAKLRKQEPPMPYYVLAEMFGYEATSILRWLRLYDKYGEAAFTKPRSELNNSKPKLFNLDED